MHYYLLVKNDIKSKLNDKITLQNGCQFKQKLTITIFNYGMINYIFNKKITNHLKEIINIFILYEDDEDGADERESILIPKIETLRRLLIEKYARFLTEGEIESYLTKCDKIECKTVYRKNQKSRSR